MEAPPVSVVIPCYNQARWIGEAIDSVKLQNYGNSEIIVVNDGSSDDILDVMSKYPDVYLHNQENAGVSSARNAGFNISRGAYLIFLDADDRLESGWISAATSYMELNPERAFVYGYVRLIDANGDLIRIPLQDPVFEHHYEVMLHHNYIWTPGSIVYRRTVLEAAGAFDPSLTAAAEDLELNLRILRRFPAQCLDRIALDYRVHGSGLSAKSARMIAESLAVLRREEAYLEGKPHLKPALRHHAKLTRRNYGNDLFDQCLRDLRAGNWQRVLTHSGSLLRYHPTGPVRRVASKIIRIARQRYQ